MLNDLLCGCNGHPVKGAVCRYVAVGGKICKAPDDYQCEHKKEPQSGYDYELDSKPPEKGGETLCGRIGRKHRMKRSAQ